MATVTRRNGYYLEPTTNVYLPSVSTVLKASGDAGGLINWAAKKGGHGAMLRLSDLCTNYQHVEELVQYLNTPGAMEDAELWGLEGMNNASSHARNFGTAMHSAIEEYLRTGSVVEACTLPDWTKRHDTALNTFKSFQDDVGLEFLCLEQEVFNLHEMYAGRLDSCVKASASSIERMLPYIKGEAEGLVPGDLICDVKTGTVYLHEHKKQLAAYGTAVEDTPDLNIPTINGGLIFGIERDKVDKLNVFFVSKAELDKAFEVFQHKLAIWQDSAPKWFKAQFQGK